MNRSIEGFLIHVLAITVGIMLGLGLYEAFEFGNF